MAGAGHVARETRRPGVFETKQDCRLAPLGESKIVFDITWPEQVGPCVLEAELRGADGEPVHSVRDIEIVECRNGLAYQKPVTASSTHSAAYKPEYAVDGDSGTYWSSEFKDDAWLAVDLGTVKKIGRVRIEWETAFAKSFSVQVSTDGKNWTNVYRTDDGKGGVSEIKFAPIRRGTYACFARSAARNGATRSAKWEVSRSEIIFMDWLEVIARNPALRCVMLMACLPIALQLSQQRMPSYEILLDARSKLWSDSPCLRCSRKRPTTRRRPASWPCLTARI